MSDVQWYINAKTQTFEALRGSLTLSGKAKEKFNALNSHLIGGAVLQGDIVILGDISTLMSTAQEALMMAKAAEVHATLILNGTGEDDFFLENFELLKNVIAYSSMGIGVATDAWSRHMDAIKDTLLSIEKLLHEHMSTGIMINPDAFYTKRAALFKTLEVQLDSLAAIGAGLRNEGSIKRLLGLSTKSYMNTGEIAGYAEKVSRVATASKWIKKGAYIGTALEVGAAGLAIHKACSVGREEQCREAKYVEGGSLLGGLGGAALGGQAGSAAAGIGCAVVLGITTGVGAIACGVLGGAVGGWAGGEVGERSGRGVGQILYGKIK